MDDILSGAIGEEAAAAAAGTTFKAELTSHLLLMFYTTITNA